MPKAADPAERPRTLEDILAEVNSPSMHERQRVFGLSPEVIRSECEVRHQGRCQSVEEHAAAMADAIDAAKQRTGTWPTTSIERDGIHDGIAEPTKEVKREY